MKRCLALLLFGIAPYTLAAEPIRLCQDEIEERPWRTNDNNGLNTIMLRMVEQRLKQNFQIESLAWKRCLSLVQLGEFDGAIAASFRNERLLIGVYPATLQGQVPDRSRRMSGEVYYFYTPMDKPIEWDGNILTPPVLPIAAQMGYSAIERLKDAGARVDDREHLPAHLLRKVVLGIDSAAVLSQGEGKYLLADSRFAGKVVRHPIPFYQTDGYLLFSHEFVKREPLLSEQIWDSIAKVRHSATYREELFRRTQPQPD